MVSAMNNFSITSLEELMITTVHNELCLIRQANLQNSQAITTSLEELVVTTVHNELGFIRQANRLNTQAGTTSLEELMVTTVHNEACLIRQANHQNSQAMNSLQRDVLIMRTNDEEIYYIREHLVQNSLTWMMYRREDEETMINTVTNDIHLVRHHLLNATRARNIQQEDFIIRTITAEANVIRQWHRFFLCG